MSSPIPFVLTVGGSDSSSAAGIQADLNTFHAYHVYGLCALTVITAQNSLGIQSSRVMDKDFVLSQIEAVAEVPISVVKTGLLLTAAIVEATGKGIAAINAPLILDPVLVAGDGRRLADDNTIQAYKELLFPKTFLITPNADESQILTGVAIDSLDSMREAAKLLQQYVPNVLIKGRHLQDIFYDGTAFHELTAGHLPVVNPRGAGDTYSAAIAAGLANGNTLLDSVKSAKRYVSFAIHAALKQLLKSGTRDVLWHIPRKED